MKTKTFFLLFIFLLTANICLFSQYTPNGMSYQAVARDENGYELKNRQIDVKISILDQSFVNEYCESHSPITDKYGLFSLIIGEGSYVAGPADDFTEIKWGSGVHYMSVDVDFGSGFKHMGTTQFLAVPYALYAGTASNAPGSKDDQKLSFDPLNKELTLEDGGKVDLSGLYEDSDADPSNEIEFLSWDGNNLSLKGVGGNIVNSVSLTELKDDEDNDSINEIQEIHLDAIRDELTISKSRMNNPVYLKKYMDNTDSQTLFTTGDSLIGISGGNTVPMDVSKTNELQAPNLNGNDLSLTNDPTSTKVNLEKYLDNTDNQSLEISGYNLEISGGNTINIRPEIFAFRALMNASETPLPSGQSTYLIFNEEKLDMGNCYNNGEFIAPVEGLYYFDLFYQYATGQSIEIYVNGSQYEQVIPGQAIPFNYPFILKLNAGNNIKIRLKTSVTSIPQAGVFSGYRIH
jgi:hypothetical protein